MTTEPNEAVFVDVDTDDLDAFSDLLSGKAQPKPEVEVENEDEPEDVTPDLEETSADEADEGDEEDVPEVKPEKKKNRFQERIDKLTAAQYEKDKENAILRDRLDRLEKGDKPAPKDTPVVKTAEPTPDAKNEDGSEKYPLGEFDPQYIRDLTKHTIAQEREADRQVREAEQTTRQVTEAQAQLQKEWVGKLAPTTEKYPDFMEKAVTLEDTFKDLPKDYSDYLANTIKAMDAGPEVLYYLANHLDEAQKFVKLGPAAATVALGRYEALVSGPAKAAVKVSNAPSPPQVNKGSKTRVAVAGDTDDLAAFEKAFFAKR